MEDLNIIELYWQRDENAITETNAKYGKYCMTIADHILSDYHEAEECVNDTWLKAWNSMPPNKPVKLKLFLAKITRNLSFNRYKQRTAIKRGGGEMLFVLDELKECIKAGNDVESEIITREMTESINSFLREIPKKHRIVFVERYFYVESVKKIADTLGLSESNVLMILSRTRTKLRTHLKKDGYL